MNELKFVMKSNNELLIDELLNYKIINNNITFKHKDTIFKYDLTNNILKKVESDNTISIDTSNSIIIISHDSLPNEVELPITNTKLIHEFNKVKIEYTLEADNIKNEIIIEY